MKLYHGSSRRIPAPIFGGGNSKNDYGLGFYCTEHFDLAAEWSCTKEQGGFVNQYELKEDSLNVFSLMGNEYHILHWLAILLVNRSFQLDSPIKKAGWKYITTYYMPDYDPADVIVGYRADDSYFAFANAFLSNAITLSQLNEAMKLGDLGRQVVLKSQKAFEALEFLDAVSVSKQIYYPKKKARDKAARARFAEMQREYSINGLFLSDIMRKERREADELIRCELFD